MLNRVKIVASLSALIFLLVACREELQNTFNKEKKINSHWTISRYVVNGIDSSAAKSQIISTGLIFHFLYASYSRQEHLIQIGTDAIGTYYAPGNHVLHINTTHPHSQIIAFAELSDTVLVKHLRLLHGSYRILHLDDQEMRLFKGGAAITEITLSRD